MVRQLSRDFDTRPGFWQRRRRELLLVLVALLLGLVSRNLLDGRGEEAQDLVRSRPLMGTLVEIRVTALEDGPGSEALEEAIQAAFAVMQRVETIASPHKVEAGPRNRADSLDLLDMLDLGNKVARQSGGALDLAMRDLIELWGWEDSARVPDAATLDSVLAFRAGRAAGEVGLADLDRLSLGAIAKGWAVDRALDELRRAGVRRALVNAGGDIAVLGPGWRVGVQHPRDRDGLLATLVLNDGQALATSGDYERCFLVDGVRHHHLLDPEDGLPASGCQSVSVIAPSCAEADAWATAAFVAGPNQALALISGLAHCEALVVDSLGHQLESAGFRPAGGEKEGWD